MGFYPWKWYYNKTQHKNTHSHKITQEAQTKHSNESYKNIKDILHTMNRMQKSKAMPVTDRGSL
jgi:hypothetical protein